MGVLVELYGVPIRGQNLLRDVLLLCIGGLSLRFTDQTCRKLNDFSWAPIAEVAKIFLGIFISMIPAIAILKAGTDGALSGLILLVCSDGQPNYAMYFWLTGLLVAAF